MAKVYWFNTVEGIMGFKDEAYILGRARSWSQETIDLFISWVMMEYESIELVSDAMLDFEERAG